MSSIPFIDRISIRLGNAASYLFIVAVVLTAYEVMMRYLFDAPTTWVFDVVVAISGVAFLVGGTYTLQQDGHIRITSLVGLFPPEVQRWIRIVNTVIMLAYLATLSYGAFGYAKLSVSLMERTGTASNLPLPPIVKSALFISLVLMFIQGIAQLVTLLKNKPVAGK